MLQKRYDGFLQTPTLWKGNTVFNLQQFEITPLFSKINRPINNTLRLGKYVERLVDFQLLQDDTISIIAQNIQIQDAKVTVGELDCLIQKDQQPIHLEIVYKFYLYQPNMGVDEITRFIGPNRKDTLVKKLHKLKTKQLPLLHNNSCTPYLKQHKLKAQSISQQVYFKAQLFIPYSLPYLQLKTLNSDCIIGTYITPEELDFFKDYKFYIPHKKDWLVQPHTHVNWMNFDHFKFILKSYLLDEFSPLCWIKSKNGRLQKSVFVWW
ncbi:MAG: DUF1853 family protein [Flavobacteriaceae bacterium]|nr:DUF1853 family protein [Flavobacteriaceae bacterium]